MSFRRSAIINYILLSPVPENPGYATGVGWKQKKATVGGNNSDGLKEEMAEEGEARGAQTSYYLSPPACLAGRTRGPRAAGENG